MASIQLLVVEDDFLVAENICDHIRTIGFEVAAVVDKGEEAIKHVEGNKPDLILMDIRIKGEMDGIETAVRLARDHDIPFIYLTDQSDEETYQRAKATHPHAFLSKPVTAIALQRSIELAIVHSIRGKDEKERGLKEGQVFKKHFMLKVGNSLHAINLEEIEWIEAANSYCYLKSKEQKWLFSKPMKVVLESLHQTPFCKENILRISRSASVNVKKITSISGNKVLIGEKEFPIGNDYRKILQERFQVI